MSAKAEIISSRCAHCEFRAGSAGRRAGRLCRRRRQRQLHVAVFARFCARLFSAKSQARCAAGDTVLLAARLDGKIVGTVQLGLRYAAQPAASRRHQENAGASLRARPRHRRRSDGGGGRRSPPARPLACSCSIPCPAKTVTGSICAPAGRRPALCRTTRYFPMAGCAIRRSCGSGWSSIDDSSVGQGAPAPCPVAQRFRYGSEWASIPLLPPYDSRNDVELMHPHLPGFPADHRLLAGDAPVIAGQRAALAERAMAGHHERDRIFSNRSPDRA